MKTELKNAIIAKVQQDIDTFQLSNHIRTCFSEYIYNRSGEYLIGGKEVESFIEEFINLYTK